MLHLCHPSEEQVNSMLLQYGQTLIIELAAYSAAFDNYSFVYLYSLDLRQYKMMIVRRYGTS